MREGASRRGERSGVWDVGCGKVHVHGDGGQVGIDVWCVGCGKEQETDVGIDYVWRVACERGARDSDVRIDLWCVVCGGCG